MSRIPIPEHLRSHLGPEMQMDVHWVDVRLRDGRCLSNLVVRGGCYITGRSDDPNGEGELPFTAADIWNVRRHTFLFGRFWPLWPQSSSPNEPIA